MAETLNVNVLVAAKDEYTSQFVTTIIPYLYKIIKGIYTESQRNNIRRIISMSNFQLELKKSPYWATFKLEEILKDIKTDLPYLMDLITAIFVSHVKILACVKLSSDNKSIKLKVPDLNTFLHKIIINICENCYYNPQIINESKEVIINLISNCIKETIVKQIPIDYILSEYLSGVFEEEEQEDFSDMKREDFIMNGNENENENENGNENVPENTQFDEEIVGETKDIELKHTTGNFENFKDLKNKKEVNINKEEIDDSDDDSDDSFGLDDIENYNDNDDDNDGDIETEKIDKKEDPTLF
tara:strand:- start:4359 stop:5258 length:900 start_codon:yes stop_codon:yes gene_type:complete